MDIFELSDAYRAKFDESPPLFGFNISRQKLAALYRDALSSGKKITERMLQEATGIEVAKTPPSVET
jgi:hypothetical protein